MPSGDGTPRTYSIADDTANGKIAPEALKTQIEADAAITTAMRLSADGGWLASVGDAMDLWFVAALDASEITALDAVVATHTGVPIVYTTDAYAESLPTTTTSSTEWVQKLRLPLPNCCPGAYRLGWTFTWANTNSNAPVMVRVQLDDTTTLAEYVMSNKQSVGVGSSTQSANNGSGFTRVVLSAGAHFVDFDFRTEATNHSVCIGNVRLEAVGVI